MSIEKFMNAYCILTIFNLSSPLGQLKRSKEETTTIVSSASTKVCESMGQTEPSAPLEGPESPQGASKGQHRSTLQQGLAGHNSP